MDHPYYISPSKQQRNIVQLCTRLIWTMDFCSRWPGRSNMYISCTFTHYRPNGFQLSIKNSSTFERVRVFGLMTARDSDNSMMLVIAFTNSCSFLFLYVFIPLVPFLFLVSALPHGRRHRQTTLVVHSLWNPAMAGRQEYKRKHEHISFSHVLSFLSCIIRTTVVEKEFTFLK